MGSDTRSLRDLPLTGGCQCGALRYRARVVSGDCGYCHCRICQRTTGAPVLAWASAPIESFEYTTGSPTVYRSSVSAQREFCGLCGAQTLFRQDAPAETLELNVATLDEPEAVQPRVHIWEGSRIRWFDTADDLPRFEGEEPEPDHE